MRAAPKLWAVILAGGDGRGPRKLTTPANGLETPKQYCSLNGGPTLLQLALRRALGLVPRERIVVVATESHRRWWEPQLFALRRSSIVVQPCNRGTGLGILLPLMLIARSDPHAGVIYLPADHYVENEDVLTASMRQAMTPQALDCGKITLLGMPPDAPDSGFGYLMPSPDTGVGMRPVQRLILKPDAGVAAQLIRAGGAWFSGIFAARAGVIEGLCSGHVPRLLQNLEAAVEDWLDPRMPSADLRSVYSGCPPLDFSRDVLERRTDRLQFLNVPACGWSDLGTPARLAAVLWALRTRSLPRAQSSSQAGAFNPPSERAAGSPAIRFATEHWQK